jgi:hypothetical protein
MVVGRRFWILIWYGILALGLLGLFPSIYWGQRTHWKNLEELLRAIGTITVSIGMLMLLKGVGGIAGQLLLVLALVCFMVAFVIGRKSDNRKAGKPEAEDREDGER